jgi:hypothetical protein
MTPEPLSSTHLRRIAGFFSFVVLACLPVLVRLLDHVECIHVVAGVLLLWGGIAIVFITFTLFAINVWRPYRAHILDIIGLIAILPLGSLCIVLTEAHTGFRPICSGI